MCRTHSNLTEITLSTPSYWGPQTDPTTGQSSQPGKEKLMPSENTTWKPEIFIQALKDIISILNWKDVCLALDHPEFVIKDRTGLNLLMTITRLGMQAYGLGQNFPAECVYRHWNNVEGQLSLITAILKNPDIYSFADYIFSSVPVELLKQAPEADNKEISAWKSMHLVEVLLYIADNGFYNQVVELLKFPVQNCPDILFMALLQMNPPVTMLRQELFTSLIPVFLGNHQNSGVILHHAWNSPNYASSLKNIIMLSMSEWYMRGDNDQARLSRILDLAQDLKALSNLLNSRSFMFVIGLACLASRREYLNLDKWLSDKLREHGDTFAHSMVKFLQRRCAQYVGLKPEDQAKMTQIQPDTLNTIVQCLQAYIPNIHTPEVAEAASQILVNKRPLPPPPVVRNLSTGHRNPLEEQFSRINAFGQQQSIDLAALNSNMTGLNINAAAVNNNPFNFGNVLNSLVSATPASPSRLLSGAAGGGPSNSPFPMMSMAAAPSNFNNLGRIPATPTGDKPLPALPAPPNQGQISNLFPDMPQITKEIEDEANGYFQRIYNHPPHPTLSIDEVLDMLQRFQESPNRRERDVHHCMLRNLLEEYKFFPQYPEKELQITAQLFGGMIERSLVTTYITLGLALRCVLDALRKPEGSKMYYFGVTALDRIKTKLHLYQKYCEHVRSIPHFSSFPQHLIEYVEYGILAQEPPNKPQQAIMPVPSTSTEVVPSSINALYRSNSVTLNIGSQQQQQQQQAPAQKMPAAPTSSSNTSSSVAPLTTQARVKSIANATNIDTLLVANESHAEKIVLPPDNVQDKTAFIFNNLSQLNLQTKCDELKDLLIKEYYPWMSQYLVLKRASIEINFHTLYSNFLDALKMPELLILTTNETFRNIKVLLRSDKSIANFSDRSLLKNLGHWLGMLTLGRNRPILHVDIDLKSLVLEAYNKGQQELLYVVPFVAKVIESCAKSKVFKPPNPWTMAIMNVLAELHQEPELKLNLKFEIEVLCKNLNIDVVDLKPAYYLKDPERANKIVHQLSPPSKVVEKIVNKESNVVAVPQQQVQQVQQQAITNEETGSGTGAPSPASSGIEAIAAAPSDPRFNYMDISIQNYSSCLNQHMVINPTIAILHAHPQLKQVIRPALERTINDWVVPVVDRSIKIALKTTESIIRKDFALDPDETVMRTAAQYMARNLSAGMAMITCKDQLHSAIENNVRNAFLTAMSTLKHDQVEAAAQQIATDNAELVCAFIQKSSIEKCIPEVDKVLQAEFEIRKISRQENGSYCDSRALTYQAERMPIQIRLKVGAIPVQNLAVYEEFGRNIPGFQRITDRESFPKMEPAQPTTSSTPAALVNVLGNNPINIPLPNQQFAAFGADEIGMLYDEVVTKCEQFITFCSNYPLLAVQVNNMKLLNEMLVITRHQRDNPSAINLLTKSVEGLMEGYVTVQDLNDQIKIYRDIHLRVLRLLQDGRAFGSNWTNKMIARVMIECRETVRYNVDAVDVLISTNFVNLQIYDAGLAQLIENGALNAISFATKLLTAYCIEERVNPAISENDFQNTIEVLTRFVQHNNGPEQLIQLLDLIRNNMDQSIYLADRVMQGPTSYIHSGMLQARAADDDPPGFADKTEYLLKDWITIYHTQTAGRDPIKSFGMFVNKMNVYGILKGDEALTRFFRHATQMCIDLTYRNLSDPNLAPSIAKTKIFQWIDAYVRLIALLVKHSGESGNSTTKLNLLNKVSFENIIKSFIYV